MPQLVDLIMGGPGREAPVSRVSGAAIAAAVRRLGHDLRVIDLTGELDPAQLRPGSLVINIVHGHYGEDGQLQRVLEAHGHAYMGADAAASALCFDKAATKARLEQAGLPLAWGQVLDLAQPVNPASLKLPHLAGYILKPVADGSSVGVQVLDSPSFLIPAAETILRELGPIRVLMEERLPGPEYTCAVIDERADDGSISPRALPPLCIRPASGWYDFHAKYQAEDTAYQPVADAALAAQLADCALRAHAGCGCRDLSRTDVMLGVDGQPRVLEVNTLPGFTDHSLVPKAASLIGMDFDALVAHLLGLTAARQQKE